MGDKKKEEKSAKKKKLSKKTIFVVILLLAIVLVDLGIYFFYYVPHTTRAASFYGSTVNIDVDAYGLLITLSLEDQPRGEVISSNHEIDDLFVIKPGGSKTVSTPITEEYSDIIIGGNKYLVRTYTPVKIPVSYSVPEGIEPPKELFTYKESPYVTELFMLLADEGYTTVEVVPLFWEKIDELRNINKYFVFQDENREELTNQTVFVEYGHLIGEGLIYGPEVKRLSIMTPDKELIESLQGIYKDKDSYKDELLLSIDHVLSFSGEKKDNYNYYLSFRD